MKYILEIDIIASFGFIGAQTFYPNSGEIEDIQATKRYRVYKYAMEGKMGTETFTHAYIPSFSRYLMINKRQNPNMIISEVERIFNKLYVKDDLSPS